MARYVTYNFLLVIYGYGASLSCIVSEVRQNVNRKSQFFSYPTVMANLGQRHQNTAMIADACKTRIMGLRLKSVMKCDELCNHFDETIKVYDRRTDRA